MDERKTEERGTRERRKEVIDIRKIIGKKNKKCKQQRKIQRERDRQTDRQRDMLTYTYAENIRKFRCKKKKQKKKKPKDSGSRELK